MSFEDQIKKYSVKYANRISRICEPLKHHFGINYFTFYSLATDGRYSVLFSNPEVGEFIFSNKLYLHNPYLKHPDNFSEGSLVWSQLTDSQYKKRILCPIKKQFDIEHGLGIIKRSSSRHFQYDFFGFAAPSGRSDIINLYLNDMDIFEKFCIHFRHEANDILERLRMDSVNLSVLKGSDFFDVQPIRTKLSKVQRSLIEVDLSYSGRFESAYTPYHRAQLALLSPRERECLALFLEGESASRTARTLALSRRTVEHYIDSVKIKLNCDKKRDILKLFRDDFSLQKLRK